MVSPYTPKASLEEDQESTLFPRGKKREKMDTHSSLAYGPYQLDRPLSPVGLSIPRSFESPPFDHMSTMSIRLSRPNT